jgi:hypothetical protein
VNSQIALKLLGLRKAWLLLAKAKDHQGDTEFLLPTLQCPQDPSLLS